MKTMYKSFLFLVMFSSFFAMSCKKEGKVGKDNSLNIFSLADDISLGKQVVAQIDADPAQYPQLDEASYPEAYTHIRGIRDKILNSGLVSYKDQFEWRVKIIHRDDVLNAFAVPGGYMYFYTGLIKFLDNEAQFAGVMAHEMAHAARRHSTDQLTKTYGIELLLAIILGDNPSQAAQIAAGLAEGLSSLAFSRADENEADEYAVKYLYVTEYNAPSLADFFTKLGNESTVPVFLSTHPSPDNRITHINEVWQGLGGASGQLLETEYAQFKASLP
ncbi:MAG: M48 family metalloprotease [Bacteroidota bacterium]